MQNALIDRGYVTTRVLAEPQDLSGGTLALTVVPGLVRAIRLDEASSPRATLRNALPLREGELLDLRAVEQGLENLKRVPTAEADIRIAPSEQPGSRPGDSDLVVHWNQAFPWRLALTLDDSGSEATGKYQGSLTIAYDHWWTLNDLFYISLNHDVGNEGGNGEAARGTRGHTVHYSVPYGYWLLGATGSSYAYHQSVAGANQTYRYAGESRKRRHQDFAPALPRRPEQDHGLAARLAARVPQLHRRHRGRGARSAHGGLGTGAVASPLLGSCDARCEPVVPARHRRFRCHGRARGGLWRRHLAHADRHGGCRTRTCPSGPGARGCATSASARAQWNGTPLTPQDRFAIGNRYTVRGFDGETTLSGERGWFLRNELGWNWHALGAEIYAGLDYGRVSGPSASLLPGKRLAGAVIGLRGGFKRASYDVFVGQPIDKPEGFRTAGTTAGFGLSWSL